MTHEESIGPYLLSDQQLLAHQMNPHVFGEIGSSNLFDCNMQYPYKNITCSCSIRIRDTWNNFEKRSIGSNELDFIKRQNSLLHKGWKMNSMNKEAPHMQYSFLNLIEIENHEMSFNVKNSLIPPCKSHNCKYKTPNTTLYRSNSDVHIVNSLEEDNYFICTKDANSYNASSRKNIQLESRNSKLSKFEISKRKCDIESNSHSLSKKCNSNVNILDRFNTNTICVDTNNKSELDIKKRYANNQSMLTAKSREFESRHSRCSDDKVHHNFFGMSFWGRTLYVFIIVSLLATLQRVPVVCSTKIEPVDSKFPLSSWMEHFAANISSIPLTQLVIPGTHDSGSYSISPDSKFILKLPEFMKGSKLLQPIMKWQQTQGNTLYEQLSMGVRYFDIRVMAYEDKFYACHSAVRGEQMNNLLDQVSQYLKEHPFEVVLFDVHQFLGFQKNHHKELINLLQKYFPPEMVVSRKIHQDHLNSLSPGDLWKGKERIIIFYRDPDTCEEYPDYVWSNDGSNEEELRDVGGYIYRPFSPEVRDVHQLSEFMVKTLNRRTGSDKFYVLPATLFWNQWNVVWGFVCGNKGCWGLTFPTSHRQFNEGYSHMIHEHVSDMLLRERKRVNIVMMDWTTEAYNRLLIIQNLRQIDNEE